MSSIFKNKNQLKNYYKKNNSEDKEILFNIWDDIKNEIISLTD